MKNLSVKRIILPVTFLAFVGVFAVSAFADITSGTGAGAAVIVTPGTYTINPFGPGFAASLVSDTLNTDYSTIAFTYADPVNFGTGDNLILQVINNTGHAIEHIDFTLGGASNPAFFRYTPAPGIPSEGTYSSGTYTTTASIAGDVSIITYRNLNVPLTLGVGQEQDFYIAVLYTGPNPGDFTLSQSVPDPGIAGIDGAFAVGLIGLLAVIRRRKTA